MIPVKLITLKGEWEGTCEIKEHEYTVSLEIEKIDDFDCGILILSNSTVPIPVMTGTHIKQGNLIEVTCWKFNDYQGKVYSPFVDEGFYQHRIEEEYLKLFVKHKAATKKLIDKVLTCPECESVSFTIRPGCPSCGSHATRPDQLVHHYACGNVDLLETFTINRKKGSIACGKCHKEDLIINVDYDVSSGLQRCMSCGWTGNNDKLIGRCLLCDTNFLVSEAKEIDLFEYILR